MVRESKGRGRWWGSKSRMIIAAKGLVGYEVRGLRACQGGRR